MKNLHLLQKSGVIDSQTTKGNYNKNNSTETDTKNIKSSLCDCSDAYTLVTGDIRVTADKNTDVAFKNFEPFSTCKTN